MNDTTRQVLNRFRLIAYLRWSVYSMPEKVSLRGVLSFSHTNLFYTSVKFIIGPEISFVIYFHGVWVALAIHARTLRFHPRSQDFRCYMWRDPRKGTYDPKVKIYTASDWRNQNRSERDQRLFFNNLYLARSVEKLIESRVHNPKIDFLDRSSLFSDRVTLLKYIWFILL